MENKKKLVDLGILTEDEQSGVKRVSLVEEPAIELDFRYFGKQYGFVKPRGGESQDEFIGRCIPVLRNEGKPEDQAIAICYSYWEEGFEVDTAGLEPYVAPYIKKKNGKAEKPITKSILMEDLDLSEISEFEMQVLRKAIELGIDFESCKLETFATAQTKAEADAIRAEIATDTSKLQNGEFEFRYKYAKNPNIGGGGAERGFCKAMMYISRLYTKAEIDSMSDNGVNSQFAEKGSSQYDIFEYRGGCYCKHMWQAYLVYKPFDGSPQIITRAPGEDGPTRPIPRLNFSKAAFKFASEDQMILVGPCMIPNVSIPRIDEDGEKYFVRFSAETIKEICMKYFKEARTNDVNTDHEENSAGAYIYESWIVESEDDKANTIYGYNVPVGTWMCTMKVDDKATWARIKSGELRGFSIEGILMDLEELEAKKQYEKIKNILK
jgi:hypothetical protein